MAGKNQVLLTFAGDSRQLERTFDKAGDAAKKFGRQVDDSSGLLDGFGDAGGKAALGFSAKFSQRIGPLLTSAPISPALVGAVVAAAPAIGAAVTSGVLLGLGGGVLAAGIMAAAKDPKVAAAFGSLKDRASKAFEKFGEPFKAPLIRAADTFGDALERIAPSLNRMGATMAPLIDKLAPAFAQMAEKSMPGIEKAVTASVPLFEKLAEHAPAIGEAVSKFFEAIADGAPGAIAFLDIILKAAEFALPLLGTTLNWLTKYFLMTAKQWEAIFKGVKAGWNGLVSAIRAVPKLLKGALSGVAGIITGPFRAAFNGIARAWNATVGRLSFSIPGWVPGIGGNSFSAPRIPTFHRGGVVPGAPGQEVLSVLQAGERVTPAGRGAPEVVLRIDSAGARLDDAIVEILLRAMRTRSDVRAAVRAA
ncbi:MAG TPA: hypothetical protein VF082_12720 [Jiangellaceae bacterium]